MSSPAPTVNWGAPHTKAAVFGEWHGHHPNTREATTLRRCLAEHGQPALHPGPIIMLASEKLAQRLALVRCVVLIECFQAERCVLEVVEELPELRTRLDELSQ